MAKAAKSEKDEKYQPGERKWRDGDVIDLAEKLLNENNQSSTSGRKSMALQTVSRKITGGRRFGLASKALGGM